MLDPLQKKIASELQMVYPVVQMEFTVKMDKNIKEMYMYIQLMYQFSNCSKLRNKC